MGSLSGTEINIGEVIYHPVSDPNVGFAIEEIYVIKLVGPSRNPHGFPNIIWNYGNVDFLKEQAQKNQNGRTFLKKNCYSSIKDCVEFLEKERKHFIEWQKGKKDQILAEIVDLKEMLKELKKESVEISRSANKNIAMLNKLDLERDLEKRGLI